MVYKLRFTEDIVINPRDYQTPDIIKTDYRFEVGEIILLNGDSYYHAQFHEKHKEKITGTFKIQSKYHIAEVGNIKTILILENHSI